MHYKRIDGTNKNKVDFYLTYVTPNIFSKELLHKQKKTRKSGKMSQKSMSWEVVQNTAKQEDFSL